MLENRLELRVQPETEVPSKRDEIEKKVMLISECMMSADADKLMTDFILSEIAEAEHRGSSKGYVDAMKNSKESIAAARKEGYDMAMRDCVARIDEVEKRARRDVAEKIKENLSKLYRHILEKDFSTYNDGYLDALDFAETECNKIITANSEQAQEEG